ncbi:MAG: hypothetical protein ACODAJ_13025 [Planctomycetota bacterium]
MERVSARLGAARARAGDGLLTVTTGVLERTWRWTGRGLVTTGLRHLPSGREWASGEPARACDWAVAGLIDDATEGTLASLTARAVRRSPWTSPHVEVVSDVRYPDPRLRVQHVVWVYPDSPGIRTQLRLRGMRGYKPGAGDSGRVEHVPAHPSGGRRRAIGYYNETQRRNRRDTPLLREETLDPSSGEQTIDWASLLCLEDADGGLCLVKESHKCVNQPGVDTGAFVASGRGIEVTGLGPSPADILVGRFRDCWATWCILYAGGDADREQAVKAFDRIRYPIDPRRDIFIMANTWGSTPCREEARQAAREENVLREIASAADLGIDVQQIDDGWQGNQYRRWRPVKARYPQGWRRVKAAAKRHGVTLGLWAAVRIPEAALLWNYDRGGFRYVKLDFANLDTYPKLEAVLDKVRTLVEHSRHRVRVNWDVTENPPRVGYFFARDFGNIYLENRKPLWPQHVVYVPWLVLRDAWQVARYANLQKFQITVQNGDRVDPDRSNAHRHPHPYCVAITLMGSPIFFQETQHYSPQARDAIRPLLTLYRQHRAALFRGLVFPIGDEPSDASWTGFQNHDPDSASGYLLIFREIGNEDRSARLTLRFLAGKALEVTDLRRGTTRRRRVGPDGTVRVRIARPADFRFLRYEVADD